MTKHPGALEDLDWSGTSDGPAASRSRSRLTPAQRIEWLEESLDLALATGALDADRARRQAVADTWDVPQSEAGRLASPLL